VQASQAGGASARHGGRADRGGGLDYTLTLNGSLTNCTFDGAGELASGHLVGIWTNHYDSRDNLLWTKNPLGQETHYG